MNIYFAASTARIDKNKSRFLKIISTFEQLGHKVELSWVVEKIQGVASQLTSQELLLKNIQMLQEADLVVAEVSTPSFGVGYLIGQAFANRKHILCLYPDDMPKEKISDIVSGSSSSLLTLVDYTEPSLESVIRNYLAGLKLDSLHKFNFIATKEVLDFIEAGAQRENKSKSEFLRDVIAKQLISKP